MPDAQDERPQVFVGCCTTGNATADNPEDNEVVEEEGAMGGLVLEATAAVHAEPTDSEGEQESASQSAQEEATQNLESNNDKGTSHNNGTGDSPSRTASAKVRADRPEQPEQSNQDARALRSGNH